MFKSVGDDVVRGIGRSIGHVSTPKASKILKQIDPSDIKSSISRLKTLDDAARTKIEAGFSKSLDKLQSTIDKYGSKISEVERGLERALRKKDEAEVALASIRGKQMLEGPEAAQIMDKIDALGKRIDHYEQLIPRYQEQLSDLSDVFSKLNKLGGMATEQPSRFIKEVRQAPELMQRVKPLRELEQNTADLVQRRVEISKATSPNLHNDKSFITEYIKHISPRPDKDPMKMRWMLNPKNQERLSETLFDPKYIRYAKKVIKKQFDPESIKSGKIPDDLLMLANRPTSSIAKKLGIGAAAAAAIGTILSLYSWFDTSGAVIDQEAEGVAGVLDQVGATGTGAEYLEQIKNSTRALNAAYSEAQSKMNTPEAEEGLKTFVQASGETTSLIRAVLDQWHIVEEGAENPRAAEKARAELEQFIQETDAQLEDIEKRVAGGGRAGAPADLKKPQRATSPITRDRILAVQSLLSTRYPYVGETGQLDRETVRTLKQLEQEYNRLADTDVFTGLLIDQKRNHIIEAQDIQRIERELKE